MLYQGTLVTFVVTKSCPSHAQALRVFVEADNYPILIHCIHGKDRTGASTPANA